VSFDALSLFEDFTVDLRAVTWGLGERRVAGDDRRIERLSRATHMASYA
jgi:hypothetical protein